MSRQPLQVVASGLNCLLLSAVMPVLVPLLGCFVTVILIFVIEWTPFQGRGETPTAAFLLAFVLAGIEVSSLLSVLGTVLCLASPPESRGGEVVIGALLLQILGLLLAVCQSAADLPAIAPWAGGLVWAQLAIEISSPLIFLLFTHRLGTYLGEHEVGRRAKTVVKLWLTLLGTLVFVALWVQVVQPWQKELGNGRMLYNAILLVLIVVGVVAGLWGYLAYLDLLRRARWACIRAA